MNGISVAVIQSVAVPKDVDTNIRGHARLAMQAAQQGARLAVFPELSLTGYDLSLTPADAIAADDARIQLLQTVSDTHDVAIIAGAPLYSPRGLQIGALCFVPGGGVVTYTKRFLHQGEEVAFVPGAGGQPLSIKGQTVCVAICAEITHPEHAREAANYGANIYAASCFITPNGYASDAALLTGYAKEHRMAVLMANYANGMSAWKSAGRSVIRSSTGALLIQGPPEGEAVLVAEIYAHNTRSSL